MLNAKLFWLCFFVVTLSLNAQKLTSETFEGLKFRSLGPSFTSGRIADIAIHPENESIWYIAVGSGGVWKTVNAGTTWSPIFDKQNSYSIGCITIDPNNFNTIWVGTGENVGGRHVGYGDGIYRSKDDGRTWTNMGLKRSEHISKIIIHPENSDIIWVAAQGPLWSKGGERGVYKSIDGGKTWKKTLGDEEWTGATDLLIDPDNSDILFAATWQRHRTVAAYLGGGSGSGIYKSTDGGDNWLKMEEGIPKSNLGKIGLAISPFDSNVIYAAIELDRTKGGVFISKNGGISWVKQSDAVAGATGPHYYQEIYASPHKEGRLYLMNNYVKISDNHGKTFFTMNEKNKHVDSHALVFKKEDPNYLMFGTDGGLYETFDLTKTWRFIANLPLTQYYKLAVDDSMPFYNIYGGTQDNGSHGGPSRTISKSGITNADWWITLGADGHQSAIEPGNPDITYAESQKGRLRRIDQTTGETVLIKPLVSEGEKHERFNWDAPILVSPHSPTRIYFASYRVWRSDNRGDEWRPISNDITRDQNRMELPIMGKQQSWDNAWDLKAMSTYNSITSLAESPIQEGLIYAGTDDGLIQITEDEGATWNRIEVGSIKGVPATAFVNDIRADLYDASTVYAALDNHKYGDFKPYLVKSIDKGKKWNVINGDLPNNLITWRLVQDHIKKELLFVATEYGIYFTPNGGGNWIQLKGGLPTISFRDIVIQRRENDLVGASFGRGFYVLDDISALRNFDISMLKSKAILFDVKSAYLYIEKNTVYGQGDAAYKAKNPPYGAIFTYYMSDKIKSLMEIRQEKEKKQIKGNEGIKFPGWDSIEKERNQEMPAILITIKDRQGSVVNIFEGTNKKGFNRVNWKLDYSDKNIEKLEFKKTENNSEPHGFLVTPGEFTVTLSKRMDGKITELSAPHKFEVILLKEGALKGSSDQEINAFREQFAQSLQDLSATKYNLAKNLLLIGAMQRAIDRSNGSTADLTKRIYDARAKLLALDKRLNGDSAKGEIGEWFNVTHGIDNVGNDILRKSTYGPTKNHMANIERAKKQLDQIRAELIKLDKNVLPQLEKDLKAVGAPWIEGQGLINN